jgi:hypothetical protein
MKIQSTNLFRLEILALMIIHVNNDNLIFVRLILIYLEKIEIFHFDFKDL